MKLLQLGVVVLAIVSLSASTQAAPSGAILRCPGPGNLTSAGGQSADEDTANWVNTKRDYHSIQVCYQITGTATVTLYSSIDDGVTWDDVEDSASAATECYTITDPIGLIKGTISGIAATPTVVVRYECGKD